MSGIQPNVYRNLMFKLMQDFQNAKLNSEGSYVYEAEHFVYNVGYLKLQDTKEKLNSFFDLKITDMEVVDGKLVFSNDDMEKIRSKIKEIDNKSLGI